MTICANKFVPEVLLQAPRRSAGVPNSKGTLALYSTSTYSFDTHSKTAEIRVLDIKTGQSSLVTKDINASEPAWIGEKSLIWLQGGEKGVTNLLFADIDVPKKAPLTITSFNGGVSNLKITSLDKDTFAFVVSGQVTPSGHLYNPENEKKPQSSAKVYTSLFVRHWDQWVTENKNTLWYATLKRDGNAWALAAPGLVNALSQSNGCSPTKLESPVPPFGGTGDFDISKSGIVFVAKDPHLNEALYTKTDLYYLPLKTFTEAEPPVPRIVKTGALQGYSASPTFSPDAKSVAFTRMQSNQYESDKPRLLLLPDLNDLSNVQEFYETKDGVGGWDLRPEGIIFSADGKELYVTAEEKGRGKLFKLPSEPSKAASLPKALTQNGTVGDMKLLANGELFVTSSSIVDNSTYSILDPSEPIGARLISSNSKRGKAFGLSQEQVGEIWYKGAGDYQVHAWVVRPSNFDKDKKYPLAFLIHGGPQGAWADSFSTRWNPAVFAEQGYVVVTPNPTGSTGYGMALQNGIRNDWGGKPYYDLVLGFQHIENTMPYVDTDRAVALGASYGGFMVNWIQGQSFGRKFKALVTHDGIFSTLNQYASEELFFPIHDFEGNIWDKKENYAKFNPADHIDNWATPHLIIHSELDYRLPISEGLTPFNVLQSKGIPSKLLVFPDENHWVLKPENSLVWHREVLGWINKYSGVEAEQQRLEEQENLQNGNLQNGTLQNGNLGIELRTVD